MPTRATTIRLSAAARRERGPGWRRATAWSLSLVLALLVLASGVVPAPLPAEAALQKPFDKVFSTQDNGAISIIGNAQLTCPAAATGCTAARTGGGTGTALNNNNYTMSFVDVDDVASTTNSSSAELALPSGSKVLYARLIWSARLVAGGNGVAGTGTLGAAKFRAPNQSGYTAVTATSVTQTTIDTTPYQASLDVTATVRDGGNGTYSFADMVAATGSDRYAGWSLAVVYANPSLPLRDLTVFDGFADISTATTANSSVSTTVSGFITPTTGTVNATVGVAAWEGDLGTTGDVLKFGGTTLADAARPANNSFDSAISTFGIAQTSKNPPHSNNFGVDMGRVSANGVLANGATSATVNVSTTGDTIYLGMLTTEIDLYTPSFAGISKTVTDLNGNNPAQVGDTLEYRLTFTNSGQDTAADVVVRDPLPAGVSYVPGSTTVVSGAGASTVPKTDAAGDDVAEYVAADRLVRVRLGTGASATAGGTVPVNGVTAVTFRATVDRAAAGSTVVNGALLDYRAVVLDRSYTFSTNTVSTAVREIADLALTKTSTPTSQDAGGRVTYALGLTNNGPNVASSAVTTDTLPDGLSYVSSAPPAGTTCSASGQTVTCTTPSLAVGASLTIPVTVAVSAGAPADTVVNTASVRAATADDVPGNNTATASTAVSRQADLRLTGTATPTVAAGNQVTYTLTTTNLGPSTASATTLSDTLPVGTSLVSATASQGSCTTSGQTVSCSLGTLAPGADATVTLRAAVAPSTTATSLADTASVTSSTPDPAAGNNTTTLTSTVTQDADLAVTQTAAPSPVTAGGTLTYTVTLANTGASDARGVTLADTVPAGLTLLQVTPTQGTCTATSPVACDLGTITPGSSARVTLLVRVNPGTDAGTLTNVARGATTTPQTTTSNDTASTGVTVVTRADLSLAKTADPNPVELGTALTYTLSAANAGPSQSRSVTLTDTLPAGTTFVSASAGCSAAGQTVTCAVGTLEPGETAVRTIRVTTPQTEPAGGLSNTAVVSSATTDPAAGNDTATFASTSEASADLSLAKTTSPSPVVPGRDVTYTLTARNAGPSAASGVTVRDTLPTGVAYRSATSTAGSCAVDGQDLTCALGALAGGATATVTVVARVDPDLVSRSTSNTATIAASTPADPTASNNAATSTTETARSADVSVAMVATTPTVRAGEEATYRVTVGNAGPSTARGVVITGQVPDGLEPVPGSSGGACTVVGRTVTCAIGTLAVDSPASLTFRARVLPSTPAGTISGTAFIGSTTADPQGGNNSSVAALAVSTAADLAAASRLDGPLVAGSTATYTVSATNRGPSDAGAVTLTQTLPAGLAVVSAAPSTGTCTVDGRTVTCTTDRLAPDGVLSARVVVAVAPEATGSLAAAVTVGTSTPDPVAGNDTATTTATVVQSADLRLSLSGSPTPVDAGSRLRYTLGVVNTGPSLARTVVLDDLLPAGLLVQVGDIATPSGTSCTVDADRRVRCDLGDLAPGASVTLTVDAVVAADVNPGTTLRNTATLASGTPTDNPDGLTASTTTDVTARADLVVTKSARSSSPIAGGEETYLVTVTNRGPSLARAVRVVDTLPAGLRLVSAVDPAGSCAADGADVTCSLGSVEPGAVVVLQVTAALDPDLAGRAITNTVRVGSDTADAEPADNTASVVQPVSAQNDLRLTKTVTSGPVVAGQPVTYRMVLTNAGPSQARTAILTDVLPEGLGYSRAVPTGGGRCGYDPQTQSPADDDQVRCTWDTVDVGASVTVDLTLTVPVDQPVDRPLTNTATAAASATDPTAATASTTSTVGASADLVVRKTLLSGVPAAGEQVRWQVSVHNDGPSLARGVQVDDPAPSGLTFTAAETGQGTCSVAADAVGCALGDLGVGATATVTVSGQLAADFSGDALRNAATATATTADPDPDDNRAVASTATAAVADLAVTNTADPAVVAAGDTVTWTVVVRNDGPSDARDVVVGDELPAGVALVSRTLDAGPGSCAGTRELSCTVPVLAAGATRTLTVVGRVSPSFTGTSLTDTARVSSDVADPDLLDNTGTATSEVTRSADLAVSQTGPAAATTGTRVSWRLTVANGGPSDATGVVLVDQLPADLRGVVASSADGTCTVTEQELRCELGVVPAGGSAVVAVTAEVDPASTTATLTNRVDVTSEVPDPDADDLTSTLVTPLDRAAGLSVTSTADPATFTAGAPVSWTLTVRDAGPSVARDVVLTDTIPAGVTVTDIEAGPASCRIEGAVLTCTVAAVDLDTPLRVVVRGTLDPAYTGTTVVNQAAVRSGTPDPEATDDAATTTTPVEQSAALSLGKAITTEIPVAGERVDFTLAVRNAGPSLAREVVVTDEVPDVLGDLVATVPDGTCAVTGQQVRCTLADVAPGTTTTVALSGLLGAGDAGTLSNTASVSSSTPDEDLTDNLGTASSDAEGSSDLAVSIAGPETVAAGERVRYTVRVSNAGPSGARDTVLAALLPDGLTDVELVSGPQGCTTEVRCPLGSVGVGEVVEVVVTARLAPGYADPALVTTATVASSTADPSSADNTSRSSAVVTRVAALTVEAASTAEALVPGGDATYTFTVTNTGPSTAADVTFSHLLPDGVSLRGDGATGEGGACRTDAGTVRCDAATLAPGAVLTVTVPVTLAASSTAAAVTVAGTASSTTSPEPVTGTLELPVRPRADLTLTATAPATAVAGTSVNWGLQLVNAGPSDAQDVVLTDTLPAGVGVVGVLATQGTCTLDGRVLTCSLGAVAAGRTVDLTLTTDGVLDPSFPAGTVTNRAVVTSPTDDGPADGGIPDGRSASASTDVTTSADLVVSTVASSDTAVAGGPVRWTVTVSNTGPSTARDVVLTDLPVDGLRGSTLTPPAGVTCEDGVCRLGDLLPGADAALVFTVTGEVPAGTTATALTNTATVTSGTDDPDPGDNRSSATVDVVRSGGLAVTLDAPAAAVPGTAVRWTVTVTNSGPSLARDVVLEDLAPSGISGLRLVDPPAGVTCTDGPPLRCALGDVAVGAAGQVTLVLTGTLAADFAGAELVNTVGVRSATPDPDSTDDTDTAVAPVRPEADLALTKTGPERAAAGAAVAWRLTVSNAGPSQARQVVLADAVPAGVSGIAVSAAEGGATCTVRGSDVTCTLAALAPDGRFRLDITGVLDAGFEGASLTNSATVGSAAADPDPADNQASSSTQVANAADLSVTKTGPGTLTAGRDVSWQLAVRNDGPSTARSVVLTDPVPAGVEQVRAEGAAGVDCTVADRLVTCVVGSLADGQRATATVSGVVAPGYDGERLVNAATARSATPDPTPEDATSAPVASTVSRSADVSVTKTVGALVPGREAAYTLTVANAGPSTARGVVLTDDVPDGLTVGAVTGASCSVDGQQVRCDLGELGLTGSSPVVVVIPVAVADDVDVTTLSNTASALGRDPDPDVADNTATAAGEGAPEADLSVDKETRATSFRAGGTATWTVTARNAGPSAARDVTLTDRLPEGLQDVTATVTSGPAADCAPATGGILRCTAPVLRAGGALVVQVTGRVDPEAAGAVTNGATVTAAGSADPDTDDATDQVTTPLSGGADVGLTKVLDTAAPVAGRPVTWTLTATNAGPATARGVVVTDVLPAEPDTARLPRGCTAQGRTITCAVGDLGDGESRTLELVGTLDPSAGGPLSNTATVSTTSPDPDPADDTATTAPVPVRRVADVGVTKVAETTGARIGDEVTYRITATDAGPSDAPDVVVAERWPAGLAFVRAETATGEFDEGTRTWQVGPLAAGATAELRVVGRVVAAGELTNAVTVTAGAGTVDPDPANGVADVSLSVPPAGEEPVPPLIPPTAPPGPPTAPSTPPAIGPGGSLPRTGGPAVGVLALGLLAALAGAGILGRRRRR